MAREIDLGNVKGPKGDKGERGMTGPQGPAGPNKIADNLATTDTTYALSANQGKVLNEKIDKITLYYTDEEVS